MASKNSIEIIIQKINQSRKEIDELKQQIIQLQQQNRQLHDKVDGVDKTKFDKLEQDNRELKERLARQNEKSPEETPPAVIEVDHGSTKSENSDEKETVVEAQFSIPVIEQEKSEKKEKEKEKKKKKKDKKNKKEKKKKDKKRREKRKINRT